MDSKSKTCLACGTALSNEDRYCSNCGLETVYRNLSIKFLIKSFFEAFLNFDIKMFHSIRDIWVPNKITKTFLEGKREYHVHPFRFYFICLILFFGLLSLMLKDLSLKELHREDDVSKYEMYMQFDTISQQYEAECDTSALDSLRADMFSMTKDLDHDSMFTLNIFGTDLNSYGISTYDAYRMNIDSLYNKYSVEKKWDRYALAQYIRIIQDPEGALRFTIANMIWGLILLTIIMGFVLHVLYVRHESFYIEDLLHIANYHCMNLLMLSVIMAMKLFIEDLEYGKFTLIAFLGSILYLFVSLNKYYSEPWYKTLLKMMILLFIYSIVILFIMAMIFVLSMYLY